MQNFARVIWNRTQRSSFGQSFTSKGRARQLSSMEFMGSTFALISQLARSPLFLLLIVTVGGMVFSLLEFIPVGPRALEALYFSPIDLV